MELTDSVIEGDEIGEYDPSYDQTIHYGHTVEACGAYEGAETIAFGYASALHDTTLTTRDNVTG